MKELIKGYKSVLQTLGLVLVTTGLCLLVSAIFVFPLWFVAEKYGSVYTIACLVLVCIIACIFIIKKSIKSYRENKIRFLVSVLKLFVVVLSIYFIFNFIMSGHRLLALVVLILGFLLHGFVAFGLPGILKSK